MEELLQLLTDGRSRTIEMLAGTDDATFKILPRIYHPSNSIFIITHKNVFVNIYYHTNTITSSM